ncbi:permease prefix domain 1-containing protein [Deinococcus radiopugnans]|uniref:permease prefix domain 1-containing protein n=1 Tax=Deinococcus radiopugnans TaxID=57497 RepID=UPI00361A7AA6
MTRRARGKGRVLGLDAYIHRATLGLPRGERLDAAAELRTHLLERVAEHMAQGFSREEAEYLTVKGMGEPQTVNRGLLGHVFTNRLGWAALAVLLVGAGAGMPIKPPSGKESGQSLPLLWMTRPFRRLTAMTGPAIMVE